mgnify:CR=1 FL=1
MDDWSGLENRRGFAPSVGSNPPLRQTTGLGYPGAELPEHQGFFCDTEKESEKTGDRRLPVVLSS